MSTCWSRDVLMFCDSRVAADDKVKELENPVEDLRRYKANLSEVVRLVEHYLTTNDTVPLQHNKRART